MSAVLSRVQPVGFPGSACDAGATPWRHRGDMAVSTRPPYGGALRHRSPQVILLAVGGCLLLLLVVLALLSLAGWL